MLPCMYWIFHGLPTAKSFMYWGNKRNMKIWFLVMDKTICRYQTCWHRCPFQHWLWPSSRYLATVSFELMIKIQSNRFAIIFKHLYMINRISNQVNIDDNLKLVHKFNGRISIHADAVIQQTILGNYRYVYIICHCKTCKNTNVKIVDN